MPVRLSDLMRDTRTMTLPVGDDVLTVTYRPSGITPETEERLAKLGQDQRLGASMIALLTETLTGWDLVDDKGKPLPITEAQLRKLPMRLLGDLVRAMTEDMRPNASSGGTSAAS